MKLDAIHLLRALAVVSVLGLPAHAQQETCVVAEGSSVRILVGKGGLFRVFGHEHVIETRQIDACAFIDPTGAGGSVTLRIPTASLQVVDPDASEQDRTDVQKTMREEVLEIERYPEVVFISTAVEQGQSAESLRVTGDLTIHGTTRTAAIPLILTRRGDGSYRVTGGYEFRQTAFGIETVRLLGGTISVKDEVRVEFDLNLRAP